MHTQKMINKILAVALAFVLAFTCATVQEPIKAQAASSTELSSIMSSYADTDKYSVLYEMYAVFKQYDLDAPAIFMTIMGNASDFDTFETQCEESGTTADTVMNDAYDVVKANILSSTAKRLISVVLKAIGCYTSSYDDIPNYVLTSPHHAIACLKYILETQVGSGTLYDKISLNKKLGDDDIDSDDDVTVSTDLQDTVKDVCDAYIEEYAGYYLCESVQYDKVKKSCFKSLSYYEDFIEFYKIQFENYAKCAALPSPYYPSATDLYRGYNTYGDFVVVGYYLYSDDIPLAFIDEDWGAHIEYAYSNVISYVEDWNASDSPTVNIYKDAWDRFYKETFSIDNYASKWMFVSTNGEPVKVFKTLQGFKDYSCGDQSVYTATSYVNYSPTTTTYSGSYVNSSNIGNDYSSIQQSIDNSSSTTTIDESTVNNIVNNYYTTNVYNYDDDNSSDTSSGDSGSSSSDDSSGSSWLDTLIDGLGSLVSGIVSLLGVLVGAIGDLLVAVTDIVGSLMDSISNLSGSFSDFGSFLGETFAFIPDEVWSAIALGFEVSVLLMAVNFIKGFI